MDKHDKKQQTTPTEQVRLYDRVLARLEATLDKAEHKSWDYLKTKIDEAIELEQKAEEMTRDELDLLKAYLVRDLQQLGHYAHETGEGVAAWLNFDLNYLEDTFVERLKGLADKTRLDYERLREQLDHGADQYMAGEITAGGTFECLACGKKQELKQTGLLVPCTQCQSELFSRVTGDWSA
ncbi:zinc ribbon-containing protein [Neptunomonas phycophila]|uniref:zinc ribbon-containing protein n=1 Tax=Neptunomonas phycophila TaxID=1572645 RepID=UPI0030F86A9F